MPATKIKPRDRKKNDMQSTEIAAVVTLVPYGYQIDLFNNDGKRPKNIGSSCRDFGGSYSPKQVATTICAAFLRAMERLEFYHKRSRRYVGISDAAADQMIVRSRAVRKAILACLADVNGPQTVPAITDMVRGYMRGRDVPKPKRPLIKEVEEEAQILRDWELLEREDDGYTL